MVNTLREIKYVDVDKLRFDPHNPRLPSKLRGTSDENPVIEWMLRDATIVELMRAIGEKGYFPGEPLLVIPAKRKEHYEVVEGNRRLCAVKLLSDPDVARSKKISVRTVSAEAKHKPQQLPVIIYENRNQILDYLGYRHITGVKEWDTLAKARHLDDLLQRQRSGNLKEKFKSLARGIGSTANYVARLLTSLRLYEEIAGKSFYKIPELDEETIDFSVLLTALSYKDITGFLELAGNDDPSLKGLNKKRLKELTSWLFERDSEGRTRIGESRGLKDLSSIVNVDHAKALAAFRKGTSLSDSVLLTGAPTAIFRTALNSAGKQLKTAKEYSRLVEQPNAGDSKVLSEIREDVGELISFVDKKMALSND